MLSMKFATDRPFADPERIAIELINLPFLRAGGSPDEYHAGIERAIGNGWLWRHESGVYVKFTEAGADLFA